ncbi:hypothetical protein D9619_013528 [Psilocybe cf. subviscida]|uniref:Uncharacterized protein n=1 Tax=Psilocybe cf. subviscida TaxID=2480587 RepID=A0A8H5F481_9AGAR|nr:hypothetical protein D9619_013528 [Psilocybe cf. subviscida]
MSEPTALKIFEHAYYIGDSVGDVLLGVNLTVYVLIMRALFDGKNASNTMSMKRFHAFFATSLIVILVTEAIMANFWGEEMLIVSRNNIMAGGVPGWILTKEAVWYGILRDVCADALAAFGDAFLLYRLYTIYRANYVVIVVPSVIYLATIAVGVVQLTSFSTSPFFSGSPFKWNRVYLTLTVSFNLLVTILILVRLRMASKAARKTTGHNSSNVYGTISAMIIESAAIYATFTITFLVVYWVGSPVSVGIGNAAGKVTSLTQLLIILRVANRTAWSHNTMKPGSQSHGMQFAPGATATSNTTTHGNQISIITTSNHTDTTDKKAWNNSEGCMA